MERDPFIDTAILAEQTIKNAARLRDTTLRALAQKAQWRISQTMEPDFRLELDLETAGVPLLDVYIPCDPANDTPTDRVQLPADKANPWTISELVKHVCLDGPVAPVRPGEEANPSNDVLLYDNLTGELKGRIELK